MSEHQALISSNIPSDYTGIACVPLSNGNTMAYFIQDGKSIGRFECSQARLATMAANLLAAAQNAYHVSGKSLDGSPMAPMTAPVILANRFALAPNQETGFETLAVQVGEAVVGFAIHNSILSDLGKALQLASAMKSKPN
jgi:hypothetical protein